MKGNPFANWTMADVEAHNRRVRKQYGDIGRLPPDAQRQRDSVDEPVAADAREAANKVRCLVRFTSYRTRLCDERNLWDKHFTDALVEAGLLFDDSPTWCKVEVAQVQVKDKSLERTEITVSYLSNGLPKSL